jgi:hypothetical protein
VVYAVSGGRLRRRAITPTLETIHSVVDADHADTEGSAA